MSKAMQLKARINNLAHENNISAQAVLQDFMLERLLERITRSKYNDNFILKGGMLIASLVGINSRTTMDMDATIHNFPLNETTIKKILEEICAIDLKDEVTMDLIHIEPIWEDDEYGGYRVSITARFESITIPLKMDITTGDAITPKAVMYKFRSNFEEKEFPILVYPLETILAEKIETILRRSVLNTRPRDFYDVYILLQTQRSKVRQRIFKSALQATAEKRQSRQIIQDYEAILSAIQADRTMGQRWERYGRDYAYARGIDFEEVIRSIAGLMK